MWTSWMMVENEADGMFIAREGLTGGVDDSQP